MPIELRINAENAAELKSIIAGLAYAQDAKPTAAPAEVPVVKATAVKKATFTEVPKVQAKTETKKAESKSVSNENLSETDLDEDTATLDFSEVKKAILLVGQKLGRDKARELLGQFGYEKVGPHIKVEDFKPLYDAAQEALSVEAPEEPETETSDFQ